jgi:ribosomal protein S12 methylthiotransferase
VKEVNLIAQDVTAYGRDLQDGTDLTRLLQSLVKVKGLKWIRLLYAHPGHVTPELIRLIREEEKICKYLDLPLQHIDDHLLRAMNRPVSSSQVRELIARLRKEIPGITLRTSLMVGFPGETEKRFRRLFDLVKEAHFEHLGVFRYSKEEGTAAATLKGHVSARVKEQRYHQIMRLQRQISLRRQKEKVGTHIPVLIERPGKSSGLLWEGRTQGQAPEVDGVTFLRRGRARPGEIVEAVITKATAYDFYGDIIGPV